MTAVFRHQANYRKSRRRRNAAIQWQYDTEAPAASEPKRVLSEIDRRRRRTEYRQHPRWEYERINSTLRRRITSLESSSLSGAGAVSALFDEAGVEPTFEFSQVGVEHTYLFSAGLNL